MALTTFSPNTTIKSAEVNANFALCVLTDTARTVTVTHTWTASQTFSGGWTAGAGVTVTSTTTPQQTLAYDGTHSATFAVNSAGALVINATSTVTITPATTITGVATLTAQPILSSLTASQAVFTDGSKGLVSNAITGSGNVVMSASPTLTGTITAASATLSATLTLNGTVAGTPTWSSSQAITLSTAAQPNITSVGTLTSLTVSAGTDAATSLTVGTGGGSPSTNRSAVVTLNTPHSGGTIGAAVLQYRRASTLVWEVGIDKDTGGAKTSTTDYDWWNGSAYVAALSTAGALTLSSSITTGTFSGGSGLPWKFGDYLAGGAFTRTGLISVSINGVVYTLAAST